MSDFCYPMDCSLSCSSVHGISQVRILEWIAFLFSRGIFLTQGSNPCLLHWQADSLPLSHQGSPSVLSVLQIFRNLQLKKKWARHSTISGKAGCLGPCRQFVKCILELCPDQLTQIIRGAIWESGFNKPLQMILVHSRFGKHSGGSADG